MEDDQIETTGPAAPSILLMAVTSQATDGGNDELEQ
jgi:hypothetical protein